MIDLNTYLNESIFDDEDTHMENLDKIADVAYVKKLLLKDDYHEFEKSMDEFEKMIKKDYKKIPASKVDYGNNYLLFLKGENMWNKYLDVSIFSPMDSRRFQSHMIGAFAREDGTQEVDFRRYYNESKSVIQKKLDGQNYKTVYELPKEYEWMIEWMNKEYEDGRYKRVY